MTIDEMIAVLQAAKAGKVIEGKYKHAVSSIWGHECYACGAAHPCHFNFGYYDYRVTPEPREWTVSACTLDHKADAYPRRCDDIITVREVLQ